VYNILVPTAAGHDIEVQFGAKAAASAYFAGDQRESVTLNYSVAVVPEPLSTILFITGGAVFAGRRYLKQEKV
jgi:hypothetical protein